MEEDTPIADVPGLAQLIEEAADATEAQFPGDPLAQDLVATISQCPCFDENDLAGTDCETEPIGSVGELGFCSDFDPGPYTRLFAAVLCDPDPLVKCEPIFFLPTEVSDGLSDNQCMAADLTGPTKKTGSDAQIQACLNTINSAP